MASYTELRNLFADDELKNRFDIAVIVAAYNKIIGTPTAAEQKWASAALSNPRAESEKALRFALAANSNLTPTQIKNAADTALQSAVDAVVNSLIVASGV